MGWPQPLVQSKSASSLISDADSTTASDSESSKSWALEGFCQVRLHGLPNALLDEEIMRVVLEEAFLWQSVLSLSVARESASAHLTLASEVAAKWCVSHFRRCSWGASGQGISAEILPSPGQAKGEGYRSDASSCSAQEVTSTSRLSAAAPEFVPFAVQSTS